MTKEIPLTRGFFAIVDDEDYDWLSQWKWHVNRNRRTYYAANHTSCNGRDIGITMHRLILAAPRGIQVDHIDGNGLNNRRENLRFATVRQQCQNRRLRFDSRNGYKGITHGHGPNSWRALINIDGQNHHLGTFDSPIAAARAYDKAAIEHFGPFARINDIAQT